MNRNEMITEINKMYDKLNTLETKQEFEDFKAANNITEENVRIINRSLSDEEQMLMDIGKEQFFERIFYSYRGVSASRDTDGKIVLSSFDKFCKEAIRNDNLPMNLSADKAIKLTEEFFKAEYLKKAEKSTKALMEKEAKEAEENREEE